MGQGHQHLGVATGEEVSIALPATCWLCRPGHVPERRRDECGAGMQGRNHARQLVPANCDRCTSVPNIFHPFPYPTLPLRSDRWQANHDRYRTPRMPSGSRQAVYPTDLASSSSASAASANSAKAISASSDQRQLFLPPLLPHQRMLPKF